MKSHLELISTRKMTQEEWLAYRFTGLGASEVGTILGLDDYKSAIELYYEKIGEITRPNFENIAMFMGKEQEPFIARLWSYWEGSEQSMIENFRTGRVVRRCQRVNAYVRNPAYPWLFVSLDRKINRTESRGEGTLELKTIGGFEMDKWEYDIPPKYVAQVNTQMLVPEFDHGELALFQDGRRFDVFPFEPSTNVVQQIVVQTKEFWDKVQEGRKFVNEKYLALIDFNQRRVDECQHEIDKLAPEPDGTLAYASFMKEKYLNPTTSDRLGTDQELADAIKHLNAKNKIKSLERDCRLYSNRLKAAMGEHQVLMFGESGKVYWTKGKSGSRVFKNRVNGADLSE